MRDPAVLIRSYRSRERRLKGGGSVKVEIWSDVICPWCYIGKRRFEAALARFPQGPEVEVVWRSFELDPDAPAHRQESLEQMLSAKYGMTVAQARAANDRVTGLAAAEGLEYRLGVARPGNTFDAHRLLHLAARRGVQGALKERLFRAYFTEGEPIGEPEALVRLAAEAGIDAEEARVVLESGAYAGEVRADEEDAAALGAQGVPFFVIDRAFGVSGAQPADVLLRALRQAWPAAHPLQAVDGAAAGDVCSDDGCKV